MKKISRKDFDYLVHCAEHYDYFTQYIDDFHQQEKAEERNAAYSGDFDEILAGIDLRISILNFANLGNKTVEKVEEFLNENGVEIEVEAKKPIVRIWTEEEIKKLILTNDIVLYRGIKKLYDLQTEDEQNSKSTKYRNGAGFNAVDGKFMSSIAEYLIKHRFLTEKQKQYARKKMLKYAGQLTAIANS